MKSERGEIQDILICRIQKRNYTTELTHKRKTKRLRERTQGYQRGRMGGRDNYQAWDGHVHTAIFKMDSQQGPTVQHRELGSILHGSLHGRGVLGRMDTCIGMAESLSYPLETITILLMQLYSKSLLKQTSLPKEPVIRQHGRSDGQPREVPPRTTMAYSQDDPCR